MEHTVRQFLQVDNLVECIIATGTEHIDKVNALLQDHMQTGVELKVVAGGTTRQASVYEGLKAATGADLVAVHDAVRPFIAVKVIERCINRAEETGAAAVAVPVKNTVKRAEKSRRVLETVDRSDLWQVQTPQIFQKSLLKKAFEYAREQEFVGTDDASLVEHLGEDVYLVEGDQRNIKITYPEDLELAELMIQNF